MGAVAADLESFESDGRQGPLRSPGCRSEDGYRETCRTFVKDFGTSIDDNARLNLAIACVLGAQAVDLAYHAAGTASIFTKSLLERFFRDVHVATQHRFASPEEMYQVGRVMLGAHASS